ncbi:hypothetical protein Tco_1018578 [Tanacetum coccineum]|uniref:Retrovirus-related Pol polyprotein from transposon TNT 1-94-like beta-barrel domain-containing protein n=1 Tax=Tanacetum coccineum TaxID=301880 RepID=A0ABQ5FW37_9ASTR
MLKFIEADRKAKRLETELQNQFILDRDTIRALEKERDDFQLNVSEQRKHVLELQNAQTVLKRKLNANEDKYLDDVLTLEAKLNKNENVVIKMSQSVQALFMLVPKPLSFYDTKLKHGLGSKVHVNVFDTEEILEDTTKSQIKIKNKLKDPIAIEKKQIYFRFIDYKKLNALYKTFVPQVELSAEPKYFSSVSMTSETPSNASTSSSPPTTTPRSKCENIKLEYQQLFDSIKKTWTQSQKEINELIENVNQKTYAYGDVRAKNQDLLITISELKAKLKMQKKIIDSGCSKHMTGDLKLLKIFVKKFMGTIHYGNDHFAAITGYGDYVHGNITTCHVYYVEGLRHNLFSVGQLWDGDLEVAFRSKTCYVRNLEGDDLLTGGRGSNLDTFSISNMQLLFSFA